MSNQTTKNLSVPEFLNYWQLLNEPGLTMPHDHLSDAITRVIEYNNKSYEKIFTAHNDMRREHARINDEGIFILDENKNLTFIAENLKKLETEIKKYNEDSANNVDMICYIKPTEKLPKRLFTFDFHWLNNMNGVLFKMDLDALLDKSLEEKNQKETTE